MNALKPLICTLLCLFGAVPCLAQTVTEIPLTVNHIVYSPQTGVIYASVPSRVGAGGNSITVIDPVQAKITGNTFVGSEPDLLALSDDGRSLYTTLDGAAAIERVDLPALTPGLFFHPDSPQDNPAPPTALAVLPGHPHSFVAAVGSGLTVFDDSVARPEKSNDREYVSSLAFSSPDTVYASEDEALAKYSVTAQGVTVRNPLPNLANRVFDDGLLYSPNTKMLYSSTGVSIDPVTLNQAGIFNTPYDFPESSPEIRTLPLGGTQIVQSLAADPIASQFYVLSMDHTAEDGTAWITAYDSRTYLPLGSLPVPNAYTQYDAYSGVSDLITWGTDGLAFHNNDGDVFIVNGRSLPNFAYFSVASALFRAAGTATGIISLNQPAPAGGITIALSSDTSGPLSFPATVTIPPENISVEFPVQVSAVTASVMQSVYASYGAERRQAVVEVLPAGQESFAPANEKQLSIGARSVVANPKTGLLYASVPSNAPYPGYGNSLAVIDPVLGGVVSTIPAGSEPDALGMTDDGTSLYVGVDGSNSVRRYDFATGTFGLTLSLGGGGLASKIAPLPGKPHSFALQFYDTDGTVIYDDLVPRPEGIFLDDFTTGTDPSHLYGYQDETFYDIAADAGGLAVTGSSSTVFTYPAGSLKFAHGLVYGAGGQVVDPTRLVQVGAFAPPNGAYSVYGFYPDAQGIFVYAFASDPVTQLISQIVVYDAKTYAILAGFPLSGVDSPPTSFAIWAPGEVAFTTEGGRVFIVNANAAALLQVGLFPHTLHGGTPTTGRIQLSNGVRVGGIRISLISSDPSLASVPATIEVPAGQSNVSFPVTTQTVTSPATVTITATYGGRTRQATLTIQP